jgi:hypothetical protein
MFLGFLGLPPAYSPKASRLRGGKLRDPLRGIAPNSPTQLNNSDKKTGSTESGQTHFDLGHEFSFTLDWLEKILDFR